MAKIEVNILSFKALSPIDLCLDTSGNDIPRAEFQKFGSIAFHEAFSFCIDEIASFSSGPLCDQDIRSIKACRVELKKLPVLQGYTGLVSQVEPTSCFDH